MDQFPLFTRDRIAGFTAENDERATEGDTGCKQAGEEAREILKHARRDRFAAEGKSGSCYLKLCTDTQEMGYVLKADEVDAPPGLRAALVSGNHWQDILTGSFQQGRTGNEILAATIKGCAAASLTCSTYSHPLGFFGHALGPTIGMWDNQGPTPGTGEWPLHKDTVYAIEGNVTVSLPE